MSNYKRENTPLLEILFSLCMMCCLLPQCSSQEDSVSLTSTESTITLEWEVDPNATFYQASYHQNGGFIFTDEFYEPPFQDRFLTYRATGLLPGVSYIFLLFKNGNDSSDRIFFNSATTVPLPPENFQVLNRTSGSLLLTWDPGYNSSQNFYEIEYHTDGSTQVVQANLTDEPVIFNLTDLRPGYTYVLSVRAVSYNIRGNNSDPLTAVTAPAMPANLNVTAVDMSTLRATWESGTNSLQDSFEVKFSVAEGSTERDTGCTSSPCDFPVGNIPGQMYAVFVYAVKQIFRSVPAVVLHNTVPAPPENLNGVGRVRALDLTWNVPSQGVFDSFRISLTNAFENTEIIHDVPKQGNNTVYSYSVPALKGGVNFFVRVYSVTSTETSTITASHLYFTLPEPVTGLTGQSLNTTAVEMSWQNPFNTEVTGLVLNLTSASGVTLSNSPSPSAGESTYPVVGLEPGVEYTAVLVVKSKVQVDSVPVNTTVRTKPEMPTLVTFDSKEESLDLTLSGGQDPNGIFDSIKAKLVEDGTQLTADAGGMLKFSGLTPGTQYTLDAFTTSGAEDSTSFTQVFYTKPRPPQNLQVEIISSEEINISWEGPDKGGVDNYTVTLVPSHGVELPTEVVVSGLNFSFTGAHPGETYNVTVWATKGTESSSSIMEQNTTNPESVAALQKVDSTSNSITVNWTAPVSGSFSSYHLGINPPDSPHPYSERMVSANESENTFFGLKAGKNYTVAIRTVINRFRNQYGQPVRLKAVTNPLPVNNLTVETVSADELRVSWSVNFSESNQDRFTVSQDKDSVRKSTPVTAVKGQSQYQVTLNQLMSGHTYSITVVAIREIETDIEESLPVVATGTTKPKPVVEVVPTEGNQAITVSWQPGEGSQQETYRIKFRPVLRNPAATWLEQTASTTATQIPAVFPGEKYEISVIAVSSGQESDPTNATIVVAPLSPTVTVNVAMTTTSSVTLIWTHDPLATYVEFWMLTYGDAQMTQTLNVTVNGPNDFIKELTELTSGVTYTVEIKAVVEGVFSEMVTLNATARPVITTDIREIPTETSNTGLTFEYNVSPDIFDEFRFTLLDASEVLPVVKAKEDTDRKVKFSGLNAGQIYTVVAVTISAGVVSDPVTEKILTVPNNVGVNFQNKSDEILVNFVSLAGQATKYRIQCYTSGNTSVWDEEVGADESNLRIHNLQAYTTYSITVTTIAGGADVMEKSVTKSYNIRTSEAAPSEVRQVVALEDDLRTVQLKWSPPLILNGELRSYRVEYIGTHSTGLRDSKVKDEIPTNLSDLTLTLPDLKAGYTYVFKVQAMTVALGPAGEATITLSTTIPGFKAGNNKENSRPVALVGIAAGQTTMSVTLTNGFSDKNGPITGQAVIVSTDRNAKLNQADLPSWQEARDNPNIVGYQATSKCTDLFLENSQCGKPQGRNIRAAGEKESVVFEVGVQPAEECAKLTYCNGPLKPGTDYYVKLRAFTESGFTDTEFSSKVRTAEAPDNSSSVIIGVIVGVVILFAIIAVILIVIVIRVMRRPKRASKYTGPPSGSGRTSFETSSLQKFSRPVKLRDFPDHVEKMAADSDFKYAEEYEDLKEVGRDQVCYAAELPVNRPKNRFTNILPYDHSRVKLLPTDDEEGSDYINANYMPGYTSKREYIATQGPLPATRDDFWRMVWEQNSRNIVMLTKCMEKGREKSDHYWPADSEPKFYGDLQVVILNETHMPDWTITEFRMSLGDNCRQVRHFHYKAWPDFGVPKNHSSLIRFVRTVREKLIKDGGPIVTHCSAGVGRSGTFIVLDHCLRLVKDKDEVDIFSIVYSLRRERVLMVQTEQQYKFIHECVLCVLEGREDETTYANIGQVNVGFEDDEGINVEVPT